MPADGFRNAEYNTTILLYLIRCVLPSIRYRRGMFLVDYDDDLLYSGFKLPSRYPKRHAQ